MAWEIGAYEYVSTGVNVALSGQSLSVSQGSITVTTGTAVPLTGQDLTTSQGSITVNTGTAGLTITDVDGDEIIADGQSGVVATLTGSWAVSGKRVWLEQSGNWVEQSVTGQDASSVTFNVTFGGGVLTPGAATLYVSNPM